MKRNKHNELWFQTLGKPKKKAELIAYYHNMWIENPKRAKYAEMMLSQLGEGDNFISQVEIQAEREALEKEYER